MVNPNTFREWPKASVLKRTGKPTFKKPKKPRGGFNSTSLLVDLISWWEFETDPGFVVDSHGSNDLTNVGTDQETGKVGLSAEFLSTSSEQMNIAVPPQNLKFTGDKTIAFWYRHVTGASSQENLIGIDSGSVAGIEWRIVTFGGGGDERPYFYLVNASHTQSSGVRFTDTNMTNNTWYYLLCSWEASTGSMKTYLDGKLFNDFTFAGPLNTDTSTVFYLGRRAASSPSGFLSGRLDEIGIWNRLLTSKEIKGLYNKGDGIGYPGNPVWEYASLALAESSGDVWVDGDKIQITSGALFVYRSALAVSGYSGLIHRKPYGASLGILSTVTVRDSEAANTDPDSWTNWTDAGAGSKGVDYEYDISGGLSRLSDLTIAGRANLNNDYFITSADTETFNIMDDISFTRDGTADTSYAQNYLDSYNDGVNRNFIDLGVRTASSTSDWQVGHTDSNTRTSINQAIGTPSRIFMYCKSGRWAAWVDDGATPAATGTVPRQLSDSGSVPIAGVAAGSTTASTGASEMLMGVQVFGKMETL